MRKRWVVGVAGNGHPYARKEGKKLWEAPEFLGSFPLKANKTETTSWQARWKSSRKRPEQPCSS
jgi:hypothetical protein